MIKYQDLRNPDGSVKTVALSEQQVSWAKVIGHGLVENIACPESFLEYLEQNNLAPHKNSERPPPDSIEDSTKQVNKRQNALGNILLESDILHSGSILDSKVFDTTMVHSNLAQNIYFANYFSWQGQVRDQYFFRLTPDLYRSMGNQGRLVCLQSKIRHLREAMPFDRIMVSMKLRNLHKAGAVLYFEYFKIEAGGKKEKIAFGDHIAAWVSINNNGDFQPQDLPQVYLTALLSGKTKN